MRTNIKVTKSKSAYGTAGASLEAWLLDQFEIAGGEPLAAELCRTADRLAEIRGLLAEPELSVMDRIHLIGAENKVQAMFMRAWRLAGLADKEAPVPYATPGRPSEADREDRRHRR